MLKMKKTTIALLISGVVSSVANAEMYFPAEMLNLGNGVVADLSSFRADGSQLPGHYQVDIYLNGNHIKSQLVKFIASEHAYDDTKLLACLNLDDFSKAGVKVDLYPELMQQGEAECIDISNFIPDAFTSFDFSKMRLNISVPQASVKTQARGYIDPEEWDNGINAALMNYMFSGNNDLGGDREGKSYYLNLNSGLNIGPWRLRDNRTWSYYNSGSHSNQKWQRLNTYVERTIIPFRSNLVIGESTTKSEVFDSLAFKGVQLSTDDNMYPDTMRGFAPVIRGVASDNAEVSISQNGFNVYRTNVPPGPFEITDLTPMYSSGDLEVTVRENSGNTQVFTVPFSAIPSLLREGRAKYSLAAGELRSSSSQYDTPAFAQGSLSWGLPKGVTGYGGFQFSSDYLAVQLGSGVDMGAFGGISTDITHAESTLVDGSQHQGQSIRLQYANAFNPTGTTFRVAGYQFSTQDFHTLDETALKRMQGRQNNNEQLDQYGYPVEERYTAYYNLNNSKRARYEVNISQSLGDIGSVYVTGMKQTYWDSRDSQSSVLAGYSNSYNSLSYSVNYGYTQQKNRMGSSYKDHSVNLSLSIPLHKLLSPLVQDTATYATLQAGKDSRGNISQQAGLSGILLEDRNLNWNVSQGYTRSGGGVGSAGLSYRGGYGNANLGYSHGRDYQRLNYGLSGGTILHRNGITVGQPVGETSVLLSAQGHSGVSVQGEPGVKTDWLGYAIKPYATAYRENRVAIDTRALDDMTDVEDSITRVIPTKGAIVKADFAVSHGQRVLLTLTHAGKPLPFGTIVTSEAGNGIVGDGGQVYLAGLSDSGEVTASWGSGQLCKAAYALSAEDKTNPVARLSSVCQ